jgi:hypothetical protein
MVVHGRLGRRLAGRLFHLPTFKRQVLYRNLPSMQGEYQGTRRAGFDGSQGGKYRQSLGSLLPRGIGSALNCPVFDLQDSIT